MAAGRRAGAGRAARVAVPLLAVLALACEAGGGAADAADGAAEVADAADVADPADVADLADAVDVADVPAGACRPEPWEGSWDGLWAQQQVRVATVQSDFLQGNRRINTSIFLLSVTREGDRLDVRSTACSVEVVTEESPALTVIPDALVRSIAGQQKPSSVEASGGGFRFVQDRHVDVRGARLDAPGEDALPVDGEDPRVFDQDGDKRPGITVQIQGPLTGAVWLVQRIWTRLEGCTAAGGRVQGTIDWGEDQSVLGAESPLLAGPSTITPVPGQSTFRMVPVAPGTDCAQVLARRAELFGE